MLYTTDSVTFFVSSIFRINAHSNQMQHDIFYAELPGQILESARSYALHKGYSGIKKAINVAFLGNHFASAIGAHKQALLLAGQTKEVANADCAPRKRL